MSDSTASFVSSDSAAADGVCCRGPVVSTHKDLRALENADPLLADNPRRWVLLPIRYNAMFEMYKQRMSSFWTAEDIDRSRDAKSLDTLMDQEVHFIKHALALFLASDSSELHRLTTRISFELQVREARAFYSFQIAMENTHIEACSLLAQQHVGEPSERERLFDSVRTMSVVQEKADWARRWISDGNSFAERVVASACIQRIFSSGTFCAISWLKQRGLMPGLALTGEVISRDRGLHAEFACLIYRTLQHKLPEDVVHAIVRGAAEVERRCICDTLPCELIGLSSGLMSKYIDMVADRLLKSLGHEILFDARNPYPWMELMSKQCETDFFGKLAGKYQKGGGLGLVPGEITVQVDNTFSVDADF